MPQSGNAGGGSGKPLSSFQYWYRDGGRMSGGLLPPKRDPRLFPYTTAERRPGVRLWAIFLLLLTVFGVGWYLNLLLGVLGGEGAGGKADGKAGQGPLLVVPTAALSLSDVVETLAVTPVPTAQSLLADPRHEVVRVPVRYLFGTPTPTAWPTVQAIPTPSPTSLPRFFLVRLSSYWPDDGDDWCLTWDEAAGRCVSPVTSGDDWRGLDGAALACDPAWLGHVVRIPQLGIALPCLDTGVSFVCGWRECTVGLLSREGGPQGLYGAFVDGLQ